MPFSPQVETLTTKASELIHTNRFRKFRDAVYAAIAASNITEEWRVKKLYSEICKCGNQRSQAVKKARAKVGKILPFQNQRFDEVLSVPGFSNRFEVT